MSKDANSFGHDKALAWESRGFVYTKKRMHRFDTPSLVFKTLSKILCKWKQDSVISFFIFLFLRL